MRRLNPTGLLRLDFQFVRTSQIKQNRSTIADQTDKAFASFSMHLDQHFGIGAGHRWNYLTIVAARCAPSGLLSFENGDADTGLAQMQRCRKPGKTRSNYDGIGIDRPFKGR